MWEPRQDVVLLTILLLHCCAVINKLVSEIDLYLTCLFFIRMYITFCETKMFNILSSNGSRVSCRRLIQMEVFCQVHLSFTSQFYLQFHPYFLHRYIL